MKKKTRRRSTSVKYAKDPATLYAKNVLLGKIIASRWVRLACERHFFDLRRKDIKWDVPAVVRAIGFFRDVLRLNGGQFEGKPFVLSPHQAFIVGSLFGWKNKDGHRRYRVGYVEVAKGDGKSPLAAGIGHMMFVADKEPRAEVYAAATKKDQAMILFRDAVAMVDQSEHLSNRLQKSGVGEKCWNLSDHKSGSWYKPISADEDSQSGPRPHCALIDEVHEHKSSVVIDMLEQGFKWRRQPLMLLITNSGFDRKTVCFRYHNYSLQILKGIVKDDRHFAFVAGLDSCDECYAEGKDQPVENCPKCDDWRTKGKHWLKANPNLGKIQSWRDLEAIVEKAKNIPGLQNTTRRLRFCEWTESETRYLPANHWKACAGKIDLAALRGRPCFGGLDLATTTDLASFNLVFPPEKIPLQSITVKDVGEQAERKVETIDVAKLVDSFITVPFFWVPKDTIEKRSKQDKVPYDQWEKSDLIDATPGNVIDYRYIRDKIVALGEVYKIQAIGFDPYRATETSTNLADKGFTMVEIRQSVALMSEPTNSLLRLVMAHKINHGGNVVLTWNADNLVCEDKGNENVLPSKKKSTERIDGVVALIIALSVAIRQPEIRESVYETRGVRTL